MASGNNTQFSNTYVLMISLSQYTRYSDFYDEIALSMYHHGKSAKDLFGGNPLGISLAFFFSSNINILEIQNGIYRDSLKSIHGVHIQIPHEGSF